MNYEEQNIDAMLRDIDYDRKYIVNDKDYERIFYGVLTEYDFCTSAPNLSNISKTQSGIMQYLKLRSKHSWKVLKGAEGK